MERATLNAIGYGLFFALNMAAMWLGVMPFIPMDAQTPQTANAFFVGSLTFELGFFCIAIIAASKGNFSRRRVFLLSAAPWALGFALLSWISLAPSVPLGAWVVCGFFLGWGTAGMFLAWQRTFSMSELNEGCQENVVGTLLACAMYVGLSYMQPSLATTILIACMAACSVALLWLGLSESGIGPEKLQLAPAEQKNACRRFAKDYWRTMVCIGVLGFCCAGIRCMATTDLSTAKVVNAVSMAALMVASMVFFLLWSKQALSLNTSNIFRLIAPVMLLLLMLVPIFGDAYVTVLSGALFAMLGCAVMLSSLQCLTASFKRGVDPMFAYGIFAGCLWLIYDAGHLVADFAVNVAWLQGQPLLIVCLVCACTVGLGLFLCQGGSKAVTSPQMVRVENIELVRSAASPQLRNRDTGTEEVEDDEIHKKMEELAARYFLTAREAEIAELVARGLTVKQIAQKLTISENTVRTHTKAAYSKLDIHKKAALMELVSAEKR